MNSIDSHSGTEINEFLGRVIRRRSLAAKSVLLASVWRVAATVWGQQGPPRGPSSQCL